MPRAEVAFDLRQAEGSPTGVGRYMLGLANAAADHMNASVQAYIGSGDIGELSGNIRLIRIGQSGLAWHSAVAHDLRRNGATYFSTSYLLAQLPRIRCVPVVLDLTTAVVPQHHTARTRWAERLLLPRAVRRHPLVTCTQATAADVEAYIRGVRDITVVPPNLPAPRVSRRSEPQDRYVLFVGTLEPRKNLTTALAAVDLVRKGGRELRLVVVGKTGWHADPIHDELDEYCQRGVAEWRGFVSDDDRDELYARAMAVVMPSVYEGFGLPLLEAMSRGVPCVSSDTPALVEVGGGAPDHVPTFDTARWASALAALYDSQQLREERAARGLSRAAAFTPEATAQALARALTRRDFGANAEQGSQRS